MTDHRIKTARHAGAVGKNAIVPRVAIELARQMKKDLPSPAQAGPGEAFWFGLLDFGCGPRFHHKEQYREAGVGSYGYDLAFQDAVPADAAKTSIRWSTVRSYAQGYGFNLVAASNVINVQATETELFQTCQQLRLAAGWDQRRPEGPSNTASILLNYPSDPRKLGWTAKEMRAYLRDVAFGVRAEVMGNGVWLFRPPERLVT